MVLTLAEIELTTDLDELATWADELVLVVAAGGSSAERLRSVAELVRTAGLRLSFAVLTGADRTDESLGLDGGPEPEGRVARRTAEPPRDEPGDEPPARRSAR